MERLLLTYGCLTNLRKRDSMVSEHKRHIERQYTCKKKRDVLVGTISCQLCFYPCTYSVLPACIYILLQYAGQLLTLPALDWLMVLFRFQTPLPIEG